MNEDKRNGAFSTDQKRALAHVLDQIIPPSDDGRLPGAGAVGVADYVDGALRPLPDLRSMIVDSLSALDALAARRHGASFTALAAPERLAAMNELAASEHAFPPILTLHTFAGYYQHPHILERLGLEPRPPHPKGYEMGPDDLTLLDAVRQRPRMHR